MPLCKRLTQTALPPTWVWLCGHPKALWSGSIWLGFSGPPWQQIRLLVQAEKQKGDLAVGGKHTGSCPQAEHWACHLVVKITAGSQVGQVPSFPQLDLALEDMLPASGLQVCVFPPLSPVPSSSDPQIPLCGKEGDVGISQASPSEIVGFVLAALLIPLWSHSAPPAPHLSQAAPSPFSMSKTQQVFTRLFLVLLLFTIFSLSQILPLLLTSQITFEPLS